MDVQLVVRSVDVAAPPDAVWALVGDFAAIDRWHPHVSAPEVRGDERVFDGGLVERLLARDDVTRRLDYTMLTPPFPITGHHAWLEVTPTAGGSRVTWGATYSCAPEDAAEVEAAMGDGVFRTGLDGLREAVL